MSSSVVSWQSSVAVLGLPQSLRRPSTTDRSRMATFLQGTSVCQLATYDCEQRIIAKLNRGPETLPKSDQCPFKTSLFKLLRRSPDQQQESWLATIDSAHHQEIRRQHALNNSPLICWIRGSSSSTTWGRHRRWRVVCCCSTSLLIICCEFLA